MTQPYSYNVAPYLSAGAGCFSPIPEAGLLDNFSLPTYFSPAPASGHGGITSPSRRSSTSSAWNSASSSAGSAVSPRSPNLSSEDSMESVLSSCASNQTSSLQAYGISVTTSDPDTPAWRCAYPSCKSRATFTRGCDLRKHYNRHSKHLFCREEGCPRSERVATAIAQSCEGALSGGFSSQKDLERHEAQHNPSICCEWKGRNGQKCGRVFSRMDNMKDHVNRIHRPTKRR